MNLTLTPRHWHGRGLLRYDRLFLYIFCHYMLRNIVKSLGFMVWHVPTRTLPSFRMLSSLQICFISC